MIKLPARTLNLSPSVRNIGGRFWAVVGAVSVRTKILGIVLALVFILGVGVTLQVRVTVRNALSQDLQSEGISLARDAAARSIDMLLIRDLYGLHELLQDTLANNSDVRYAFIVSPQGEILAHTFGERFPTALITANTVEPSARYHLQKLETAEGLIWDFAVPVFDGRAGVTRIGLTEQTMNKTVGDITRQLLLATVIVSLVGVAAAMVLTWLITRPVLALAKVTKAVAQGDLSQQAPHFANDEIGLLSHSFNAMVGDLAEARAKSERYNTELLHRNRELAVLNQVAEVVSRRQDLHEMLDTALDRVLDLMSMEAGWIVLLDSDQAKPQLACSTGMPTAIAAQEAEVGFLNCQCSRVVKERSSLLITPLKESCPVYNLCLASQQIVTGHVAIPLISKSEVLGTLNIACTASHCFSDEDLKLLNAIGRQLGVAVENARLWKAVRQKEVARGQLLEKIITAQEEERKRIARELHDSTGQSLTSMMVGLKVLEKLDSPDDVDRHLSALRNIAAETLDAVHDLALELRPSVLDDLGLVAALDRYVTEYQKRHHIQADWRALGFAGRRLPAAVETALYRIVQESLTNIVRHSEARRVSIMLEWSHDYVRAIVEDNGRGFDTAQVRAERKLGLYGMEERAALIGGTLRIESQPDVGTTIMVHIPLSEVPMMAFGSKRLPASIVAEIS